MRKTITRIDSTYPIVDRNGRMTDQYRLRELQVEENGLIIGTGSPEGVVEAQQGTRYMDDTLPAPASILYIKHQADIGGDKTQGWVAI